MMGGGGGGGVESKNKNRAGETPRKFEKIFVQRLSNRENYKLK